jgi:transcriptional regulator GlxA family with amidase domain
MKETICFYLQDGVEILDLAGPMEAFAFAGFRIFTVSKTQNPITSQGVLKIVPDFSIHNAPKADILVVLGGNAKVAYTDPEVISWIASREKQTKYFLSVCSGAFILAKAGLLDGLTATTFHTRIDELREAFPKVKVLSHVRFVDNGRIITTAGVSAGIDGALHLISRIKGEHVARDVVEYMEYDKWSPNQGLIISPEH